MNTAKSALDILTLNCQKGYGIGTAEFINNCLKEKQYDFLLLQEASPAIVEAIRLESYKLLRGFNEDVGDWSQVHILFRSEFVLEQHHFVSFANVRKRNARRREFGLLLGTFEIPAGRIIIGSLHVNAGIQVLARREESCMIRDAIRAYNTARLPVIFGGDFNSGLPGETARNDRIFSPDFTNCTSDSGPTCDSQYVEPVILLNRWARHLARIGIHFLLKVDHIYAAAATARQYTSSCRVLPVRVSDHSPLVLSLERA